MNAQETATFHAAYDGWFARARPALDEKRWKDAFAGFPTPKLAPVPLAPLGKPLAALRLGIVSTAGLYLKNTQTPFDAANVEGDASFRELPADARAEQLSIAHDHYDHTAALQDLNAVLPLERLRALVHAGAIRALADVAISTSGYCTRLDRIAEETGPRIAERMRELKVDAVLMLPV